VILFDIYIVGLSQKKKMPKVNTILNYFTSPKTVKKPEAKKEEREKSQTPKRERKKKGSFRNPGKNML